MRFLHTADIHLGAVPDPGSPWSEERAQAIWNTFRTIIHIADNQHVDLLLIAGDFFHRRPLRRECREANELFASIPGTRVVIIAGNHDYIEDTSPYLTFPWNPNVTFLSSESMTSVYFETLNTEVHGFSYHRPEITEARYDKLRVPKDHRFHILLGHGGDAKHIPIRHTKLAEAGFDYCAMGHRHQPEIDQRSAIAYSGSPEPTDRDDLGPRGYILGDLTEMGLRMEWIPCATDCYETLALTIERGTTEEQILDTLKESMNDDGHTIYRVVLDGRRTPGMIFDRDRILACGRVADVTDLTLPDLDLTALRIDHQGDLITRLIERLDTTGSPDITARERKKQKALYLSLEALLEEDTDGGDAT